MKLNLVPTKNQFVILKLVVFLSSVLHYFKIKIEIRVRYSEVSPFKSRKI